MQRDFLLYGLYNSKLYYTVPFSFISINWNNT
jgi:hypothetical protein